ncbi:phage portal protein [Mesoflavibacter profundi]|uniref:phage portal protein n=1 Tax=Mesoflavibacter profundi TaxID=2708110 RepID=UPI0035127F6D
MISQALNSTYNLRSEAQNVSSPSMLSSILTSIGFGTTSAGSLANEKTALTLSSFYCGINIICNDYAKLPKGVYQKTDNTRNAIQHPVKYLIDKRPNQYMTAFMFDSMIIKAAILKGNGYAYIQRNKVTAYPEALQLIDQEKTPVTVYKYQDQLWYKYDGKTIPATDMLHIPGFSFNGITGVGVVTHAARSLGVNLASETFAAEYYDGKGVGTGVLTTTKSMTDTAKTRYSEALSAMFGKKAKWVVPIIDEASKFEHIKVTPQEAQFLLSSEHGVNEVARWLNINPVKLGNIKDSNNSITESLQIEHVSDSILPWAIKVQQEYDAKLFSKQEIQNGIYTKFNTESLLAADKSTQADYWSKLILAGVYTRNEVRAMLELNSLDGLDEALTPVNTQTMEQIDAKLAELNKNLQNAGQ